MFLKRNEYYLTLNPQASYKVTSGMLFLYAVPLNENNNVGRRFFLCKIQKDEIFPALFVDDKFLGKWTFLISFVNDGELEEYQCCEEDTVMNFAKKINLKIGSPEYFTEEVIEKINVILIKEEGSIYTATQEQEKSYEKGLTIIYNLFNKNKRIAKADKTNNAIYDSVALLCNKMNIHIAPFENVKDACGRNFSIEDIARISHFTCRKILLDEDWYIRDCGAFFTYNEEGNPVVCIPKNASKYFIYNVTQSDSTGQIVTKEIAQTLSPEACMIYRPFPNEKISAWDLLKFGCGSINKSDIVNITIFSIIGTLIGLLIPFLNQKIFDDYINVGNKSALIQMCTLILVFAVSNLSFTMVKNIALFRSTNSIEYSAQSAVFDRLYSMPAGLYGKFSSVDLTQRAVGIGSIFNVLSNTAVSTLLTAVCSIMYIARMISYSSKLSLIGVLLVAANMILVLFIGKIQIKYEESIIEKNSKTSSIMYQIIVGISKIRIAGVENRALIKYLEPYAEMKKVNIKKERLDNLSVNINTLLSTVFNVIFYYMIIKKDLNISFGVFMAFISAFGSFAGAMVQVVVAYLNINHIVPLFERAKPILDTPKEYSEDCIMPGKIEGDIELSNVSFKYSPDSPLVLNDISLHIKEGEYIGIVGESGCGKSTLLKLLLGFEKPTLGRVYYDSKDIDSFDKRELRKKFGVVLQDSKLIGGSIYDNITITGGNISVNRVNEVVRDVGLENDIKQMPMKLHTVISDGGGTISGGQKQRILIARAIVNKPKILFFDEATSALDNANQALVCESLEKLNATRIVIAHRLSTIINCDRIIVMANGKIAEQGTYKELMALNGRFYELASRQNA